MNAPAIESGKTKVTGLRWDALEYLMFSLSDAARRDAFGAAPTNNPLELAGGIMRTIASQKGAGWLTWINNRPRAAFGVYECHPGTWNIWAVGDIDDPVVSISLFAPLLEEALPHAQRSGGWRVECKVSADRGALHDTLALLGFETEGVARRYGRDRGDYIAYALLLDDVERTPPGVPAKEAK
jgi:hypothetical protein